MKLLHKLFFFFWKDLLQRGEWLQIFSRKYLILLLKVNKKAWIKVFIIKKTAIVSQILSRMQSAYGQKSNTHLHFNTNNFKNSIVTF